MSLSLLPELRDRIHAELDPVFAGVRRCALVDYPNHGNPGDNAIWIGEKNYLADRGIDVAYACDTRTYDPRALGESLPEGPIVIHGGGNVGDLWLDHQMLRERVLRDFPDRRIIQMPQSVFFRDTKNAGAFRELVGRATDFTCFVRDSESLARYEQVIGRRAYLCPDMAFMCTEPTITDAPRRKVSYLLRDDQEAHIAGFSGTSLPWILSAPTVLCLFLSLASRCCSVAERVLPHFVSSVAARLESMMYDAVAHDRVRVAQSLLRTGEVVVTDRLHGHILCLLIGIPHVVLDNSYGKVHAFVRQWTEGSPLVRLATTVEEASSIAATMG